MSMANALRYRLAARVGSALPRASTSYATSRKCLSTSAALRAEADPFAALDAQAPPPPRTLAPKTAAVAPGAGRSTASAPAAATTSIAEPDEVDAALEDGTTDWSRSFSGLSQEAFTKEVAAILLAPLDPLDVEIKPDGIIYLPEIKYRRILNRAFGPGGWGLAPRSASTITARSVSREYALVCLGRLVSLARGEQDYFSGPEGVPTAAEGCRSNALMRCCKDLGIASELWDPNYIAWWKKTYASQEWVVGAAGKKRPNWTKKRSGEWKPEFLRT